MPFVIHELDDAFRIDFSATSVKLATPIVTTFVDGVDVSSLLSVTLENEDATDTNLDGFAEEYDATLLVDLVGYQLYAGGVVDVEVSCNTAVGWKTWTSRSEVAPNVRVSVSDATHYSETDMEVVLFLEDLVFEQGEFRVALNGEDVTARVPQGAVRTLWDNSSNGWIEKRALATAFDVTGLKFAPMDKLIVSYTVQAARGVRTSVGVTDPIPEPVGTCPQADVDALCAGLSNAKDGSEAQAAVDAFLQKCPIAGKGEETYTCSDERTIVIKVGTAGKDIEVTENADFVVAVGGDAAEGSSADGGDAEATCTKEGGKAIAVGGDGGSNSSSPGDGGDANAVASNGSTLAVGGSGGVPLDPMKDGGAGGGATTESALHEHQQSGLPGVPGYGGGGAWSYFVEGLGGASGWLPNNG